MNRDEILAMSREENKTSDEMSKQYMAEAGRWAFLVGGIVCALFIILEAIFLDKTNRSTWALYLVMFLTNALVYGIRMKSKLCLWSAALGAPVAGFYLVTYIMQVVGH